MSNQNQFSVLSYVPQPYFVDGALSIVNSSGVASIENETGIFDPDLSNYTTVVPNSAASSFAVQIDFAKQSGHLGSFTMSLGLIGCALLTYEDSLGSPDLDTVFSENIKCLMSSNVGDDATEFGCFAHNSQDTVQTFDGESLPSVISGGRANLIFQNIGLASAGSTATVYVTVERAAADVAARPHARFLIGHLFVGIDRTIMIDPLSFSWTIEVVNDRFNARDFGAINSDGTLVKRSVGELIKITNEQLIGSMVTGVGPLAVSSNPNFFDLTKVNTSYPQIFNAYPTPAVAEASWSVEQANLSARQNFFSIYGFMSDPLELLTDDYRDGLNSLYRARYRFTETR